MPFSAAIQYSGLIWEEVKSVRGMISTLYVSKYTKIGNYTPK